VVCFAVTVSSLLAFWNLAGALPWLAAVLFLTGFAGCTAAIWIHRGNLIRRERWKAEYAASLPQQG
jgi:cytochrome c oxidase subunit IV